MSNNSIIVKPQGQTQIIVGNSANRTPIVVNPSSSGCSGGGGSINITPYIKEDEGGNIIFNYFSPKQMTKACICLDGGDLHFELFIDEEGQFSLTAKSDIQELDGMFVMGGEGNLHDTIIDTIPVFLKGHKVNEVKIEGIDADLLNADFTWKLAEVGTAIGDIDEALDGLNGENLPLDFVSDYAKQGDNPNATMTELLDAINAISPDLVQGKERLATAITSKGVETTSVDSLYNMATKVIQIPQEVYNGVSGFEQMVAPTPYVWNIYRVATDLMSNELADYIPSYMEQYKSRYGVNSFFVAEYYVAEPSIVLTGADGYLTSDGHFYSISNNMVVHTLPNGDVEEYSAEQIEHIWERNDYINKWIAYYFITDAYSYSVAEVICPNRIALCGTCNLFIVTGTNNLLDIWVLGSLGNFEGSNNSVWNKTQVLRGYETHASATPIYSSLLSSLVMPDLKHISGKLIKDLAKSDKFGSIYLPNLETLTNTPLVLSDATDAEIKEIRLPGLRYIEVPVITNKGQNINVFNSIKHLCFDSLEEVNIKSFRNAYGDGGVVGAFSNGFLGLETLSLPNLKRITRGYVVNSNKIYQSFKPCFSNLIDIEVGEVETNLNLEYWIPLDVLSTSDNIPIINENIRNHIAARVSDRTNNTALTITFYSGLYNNLEQSTLDAFAEKNWIVAGK